MSSVERVRRAVADAASRLVGDGLAVGTAGNVSALVEGIIVITPSGVPYDRLTPDRLCLVDRSGAVVAGTERPSSELPMHQAVYDARDASAVVHTHSPYATALSVAVDELPAVHYLIADLGGPVPVVPYAPYGSEQLAEHVRRVVVRQPAVILGNHGALTCGETLDVAYRRAVLLEWLAALYWRARTLGEPRLLAEEEVQRVAGRLGGYFGDAGESSR